MADLVAFLKQLTMHNRIVLDLFVLVGVNDSVDFMVREFTARREKADTPAFSRVIRHTQTFGGTDKTSR